MVDIRNKKCNVVNCTKQPNYNFENERQGKYCVKHKLEGMINIITQKCLFNNCLKQPCYNYKNKHKGLYCAEHKFRKYG